MTDEQTITILIITLLILIIDLFVAVKKWLNVLEKIKKIRILLDGIDDSLRDDKIIESKFRTMEITKW